MATGRPAFSFFVCPDPQLLAGRLDECLADGRPERHVYWGDEEPPPIFWSQLCQESLFGSGRCMIIRQANLWPQAVWKRLSGALERVSAQCWPIFCLEVPFEKGKPKIPAHIAKSHCFIAAGKKGWTWLRPALAGAQIKRHVLERSASLGLRFEPAALAQFCSEIPPDARVIENELQKFSLAGTGTVTPDMTELCPWCPDGNIFSLIRCVMQGDVAGAWREAARSREKEKLLFGLLALLAREFRKNWSAAGLRGRHALADATDLLAMTEYRIKSGQIGIEQALESLIADLCGIFSSRR